MKILGINTAQTECGIYLITDNKIDSFSFDSASKVSENLLLEIEKILLNNHLKISDIDYIACCVGPGSFTGIRVGIAIAKAFMFANLKLKAIAYGTFDPYIFQVNSDLTLYSQCTKNSFYKFEFSKNKIKSVEVSNAMDISGENSFVIDKLLIQDDLSNKFLSLNMEKIKNFLLKKINNSEFVSVHNLMPDYICESQAERNLKNESKK